MIVGWIGGSSKAIESDLAVVMLVSGTTEQARISTIIMDEDSTTMAKTKKSVLHEVTKQEWHKSCQKNCRIWLIYFTENASHPFIQIYFLPSKMFLIRNQAAQEWSSIHKGKYSKNSSTLLWRPWKVWWKVV